MKTGGAKPSSDRAEFLELCEFLFTGNGVLSARRAGGYQSIPVEQRTLGCCAFANWSGWPWDKVQSFAKRQFGNMKTKLDGQVKSAKKKVHS